MRGNKVNDNLVKMLGTNNNILINSNFANPVNQRNYAVSYVNEAESDGAYWIDRWAFTKNVGSTTLAIHDDYVSITQAASEMSFVRLGQLVEFPNTYAGKKIALSCKYRVTKGGSACIMSLISDGSRKVISQLICDGEWHIFRKVIEVPNVSLTYLEPLRFVAGNVTGKEYEWGSANIGDLSVDTTLDIEWAKAEVSDFCTPYVPRLYVEELQLCKRYYQRFKNETATSSSGNQWYVGIRNVQSQSYGFLALNTEMRVPPTCSVNLTGALPIVYATGASVNAITEAITALNVAKATRDALFLTINHAAISVNADELMFTLNCGYIDLDAEL